MSTTQNSIDNLLATTALTGYLQAAQFPSLSGDVTTSAGSLTTTLANNSVVTAKINDSAVTYAKIQDESGTTLLGNPTGSAAAPSEITLGTGLSFSGTTLNGINTFAALTDISEGNNSMVSVGAATPNALSGGQNVGFGNQMFQHMTGSEAGNSGFGAYALNQLAGGSGNSALGNGALAQITTGSNNTGVGQNAGSILVDGDHNVILGAVANVTGSTPFNQIALGYNAIAPGDNQAQIGNASITDVSFGNPSSTVLHAGSLTGVAATTNDISGNISAGTNITLTGAGTLASPFVINGSASSFQPMPFTNVTGTTQAAAANHGYVANNASLVTITLPPTAAFGDQVVVTGLGAGGFLIAQNAGQSVNFGNQATTSGTGGSIASQNQFDSLTLVCVVANTTFNVLAAQGNLTVS